MKKAFFILAAAMILFTGCDGINLHIDDIPRTLRISARTLIGTDTVLEFTEEGYQMVSSVDGLYDGTIGDVEINSPADSYVRSSVVSATATTGTQTFAFWFMPSRTDSSVDPLSTEGNIRYSTSGTANDISLRTDSAESEIVGIFAEDGVPVFNAILLENTPISSSSAEFSFTLDPSVATASDKTISDPKYRLFDDSGEARTEWLALNPASNSSITLPETDGTTYTKVLTGIVSPGVLDNWKVIIIYKDPADGDNVYVVK